MSPLPPAPVPEDSWLTNFAKSAGYSAGSLLGITPPPRLERWRAEHPVANFGSQAVGFLAPYAGWAKVASKIPAIARAVNTIEIADKPFVTGFLRETARFAPFEIGRTALSGVVGDEPVAQVGAGAVFNLLAGGVIAGGLHSLSSAGKQVLKLTDFVPDAKLDEPLQLQLRQLHQAIASGTIKPELVPAANQWANTMGELIRAEVSPRRYVSSLSVGDSSASGLARLNSLFQPRDGKNFRIRRFLDSSGVQGFSSVPERETAARISGLPANWEELVRHPRFIEAESDKFAGFVRQSFEKTLRQLDDHTYWGKLGNEGEFIIAKRVREGVPTVSDKVAGPPNPWAAGDKWLLVKTDTPEIFSPAQATWNKMLARNVFEDAEIAGPTGSVYLDLGKTLRDSMEIHGPSGEPTSGTLKKIVNGIFEKTGLDKARENAVVAGVKAMVKEYLEPGAFQFRNNIRANIADWVARQLHGLKDMRIEGHLFGWPGIKNLRRHILQNVDEPGKFLGLKPLRTLYDKLTDQGLASIADDILYQTPLADVTARYNAGELSKDAYEFYAGWQELQKAIFQNLVNTAGSTNARIPNEMLHYWPRGWRGPYRVKILDEGDRLVALGSGHTVKEATAEAQKFIASEAALNGRGFKLGETMLSDFPTDMQLMRQIRVDNPDLLKFETFVRGLRKANQPSTLQVRTGVKGFIGDWTPYTKKELWEHLSGHVRSIENYATQLAVQHTLEKDLVKLSVQDPFIFRLLTERIRDLAGIPGPLSAAQNALLDKSPIGKLLGKGSASKISHLANRSVMQLNLGMGNLMFPSMNALTFVQTVAPELAAVTHGSEDFLRKYYQTLPLWSSKNRIGAVGVLSPLKLLRQSFREMGKPDANLLRGLERAAAKGSIDPRFIEEQVGEHAKILKDFRGALERKEYVKFATAASEYLPTISERFSRTHAFTTGWITGRDVFGLVGDDLFSFADTFTRRTMFGYSTADRSRIFTGPLGTAFGLFKNWQTHYLGNMLSYAGEGYAKGNWLPFLWQLAGTGSLAGIAGLPGYAVADAFTRWATNETLMENLYDRWGDGTDAVYLGLPAWLPTLIGMPGVSLTGSTAAPFADPARDASLLFTFVHWDRAKAAADALGTGLQHWQVTGEHPFKDAYTRNKFYQAVSPKIISRTMQTMEEGTIRSLRTGYPSVKGISPAEQTLYRLGFTPSRIELEYRINDLVWKDNERQRQLTSAYGEELFKAIAQQDTDLAATIRMRAMLEGVPMDSVVRSAMARLKKDREDAVGRVAPSGRLDEFVNIRRR